MPQNEAPLRGGTTNADLWNRPDVARALSTCDFPTLLETVRCARGWSQADLAQAVGYSQSWVSRVVNARQSLTLDQVVELSTRLDIPLHLLRFSDQPTAPTAAGRAGVPARTQAQAQAQALRGSPTRPPVGMATETGPGSHPTAQRICAITGSQRRLEGSLPAHDLARSAVAHLELSGRTLARAQRASAPGVTEIAAAASEAAGLAAWLHTDMGDAGSARGYYRLAVRRARQARNGLLTAYMMGSLAAFEIEEDEVDLGLSLAESAGRFLGPSAHPTARAWLSCVRALAHSSGGDVPAARSELAAAERCAEHSSNTDPPWPWVFPFDGAKLARYRAQAATRSGRSAEALQTFVDAFQRTVVPPKQRAVLLVEWAQAHRDSGGVDAAFRLAAEALSLGVTYRSERVISRVRRFRRSYRGPHPREAKELDARLAELAAGVTGAVSQGEDE
ncbi:helix-turn-helix transcriptional regulator [Lipingzhangella sp. LS1_29]|uniref:Helix-turn-helix transcriptional regulator n=1 Tax=Lipingzhangella rawalii TaxID=2055835 RepID=A0ABU2H1Q4_9ACTN|nr:helix-turn-helix transcriptional regulator [Lipingzhangella rawalii]MDS1268937.1 helix-turn-helix transcriptional regulator [Lipingzhangella rawalii]